MKTFCMANPGGHTKIAKAMGEKVERLPLREVAGKVAGAVRKLILDVGLPMTLEKVGVREEDLPKIAEKSVENRCTLSNSRTITYDDYLGKKVFRES